MKKIIGLSSTIIFLFLILTTPLIGQDLSQKSYTDTGLITDEDRELYNLKINNQLRNKLIYKNGDKLIDVKVGKIDEQFTSDNGANEHEQQFLITNFTSRNPYPTNTDNIKNNYGYRLRTTSSGNLVLHVPLSLFTSGETTFEQRLVTLNQYLTNKPLYYELAVKNPKSETANLNRVYKENNTSDLFYYVIMTPVSEIETSGVIVNGKTYIYSISDLTVNTWGFTSNGEIKIRVPKGTENIDEINITFELAQPRAAETVQIEHTDYQNIGTILYEGWEGTLNNVANIFSVPIKVQEAIGKFLGLTDGDKSIFDNQYTGKPLSEQWNLFKEDVKDLYKRFTSLF